ncbi:SDR family NAD(P)-dependent oxidoreductase [Sphingobium sp. EP60837]|uniref:SDR family NAD(P)-dependent oxidoreductase n=1 Tax=Sphingobium sp. EP60837 TaxID=1855519 RepID=UPI001CED6E01|nr:SDR family NAD(P)-dependent oxidoreductase [Sphingobium sp. EP60837]
MSSRAYLRNRAQANYPTARARIIGFTRAMFLEARRHFITVNAVAPGIVNAPGLCLAHWEQVRENAINTPIP